MAPRRVGIVGLSSRAAILASLLGAAPRASALSPEAETCLACHGNGDAAPLAHLETFDASAHKELSCASCHADAEAVPHVRRPAPVDCARCHDKQAKDILRSPHKTCGACHGKAHAVLAVSDPSSPVRPARVPSTCARCHRREAAEFLRSVHGKALLAGVREVPSCVYCHGEHAISSSPFSGSPEMRGAITKTCSECHASGRITAKFGLPADRVETYGESYHGLANGSGGSKVANCASCHGWHGILPSSDPYSRVNPKNLIETCGQCHPKISPKLASGKIHVLLGGAKDAGYWASLARRFYLLLIPLVLISLFLHNAADLWRKASTPAAPRWGHEELLLTLNERLQHGLLVLSFVFLAYSGFALKFQKSWWAAPWFWLGGEASRLRVHRLAALAFVLLACFHAGHLLFTKAGRRRLRALLPSVKDAADCFRLVGFNLGLHKERPALPRFSYIEKIEYWALVWGSGVMIVTGAVLVFHNLALAYFPLETLEFARTVHFLEAVLACGAIVVWHWYWAVFDPDVYPMNWAWWNGRRKLKNPGRDRRSGIE